MCKQIELCSDSLRLLRSFYPAFHADELRPWQRSNQHVISLKSPGLNEIVISQSLSWRYFFPFWHTQAMLEFLLAALGKFSNCMSKNAGEERTTTRKRADSTGWFLFISHWGLQGCRDPQAELGCARDAHQFHCLHSPCKAFSLLCHSSAPTTAPSPRPIRTQWAVGSIMEERAFIHHRP